MFDLRKIIVFWGIFDLCSIGWYFGWRLFHGQIPFYYDIAKSIALGADGVVVGTAELVALGCVRCGRCESGRGCPRSIATTDPGLTGKMNIEWGTQRLINLFNAWSIGLKEILKRFDMKKISELCGRTDLLIHLDFMKTRDER